MVWFDRWPNEAFNQIALKELSIIESPIIQQFKMSMSRILVEINQDTLNASEEIFTQIKRKIYITPSNFLETIKIFASIFKVQSKMLPMKIKKYQTG